MICKLNHHTQHRKTEISEEIHIRFKLSNVCKYNNKEFFVCVFFSQYTIKAPTQHNEFRMGRVLGGKTRQLTCIAREFVW